MPRITVVSEARDETPAAVTLDERVRADEVRSAHFSNHLLERLRWALGDAEEAEQALTNPRRENDASAGYDR